MIGFNDGLGGRTLTSHGHPLLESGPQCATTIVGGVGGGDTVGPQAMLASADRFARALNGTTVHPASSMNGVPIMSSPPNTTSVPEMTYRPACETELSLSVLDECLPSLLSAEEKTFPSYPWSTRSMERSASSLSRIALRRWYVSTESTVNLGMRLKACAPQQTACRVMFQTPFPCTSYRSHSKSIELHAQTLRRPMR